MVPQASQEQMELLALRAHQVFKDRLDLWESPAQRDDLANRDHLVSRDGLVTRDLLGSQVLRDQVDLLDYRYSIQQYMDEKKIKRHITFL